MNDWWMRIDRHKNGFILSYSAIETGAPYEEDVIGDNEADKLEAGETLLWQVLEHFNLGGGRYDKERLVIRREPGDKYEGK